MLNRISILTLIVLGTAVLGMPSVAQAQTTWYVDDDADPNGNGAAWQTAFQSVQSALDAAMPGDEIRVGGGTYVPTTPSDPNTARTSTFQLIGGVGLYGGYAGLANPGNPDVRDLDAYESILSGDLYGDDDPNASPCAPCFEENSYHVVTGSGVDLTAVLDGFTCASGNANGGLPDTWRGGGMYDYDGSPTVRNCTFARSMGDFGGGMYNRSGSNPTVSGCKFVGNRGEGGGIYNFGSSPVLVNCVFSRNHSANSGGAMCNVSDASPTLANCLFVGNSANWGGAVDSVESSVTLTNCTFAGNLAESHGGAISHFDGSAKLVNCTFTGNCAVDSGGGVYCGSSSSLVAANCIIWGNLAPDCAQIAWQSDDISVAYSCVGGGWPGQAILDADPLFVRLPDPGSDGEWGTADDDYGDLHLQPPSPCVNAGDDEALPAGLVTDFEGDERIQQCRVDMGADESPYIGGDCNNNGIADECEVLAGSSEDCNANRIPDECEPGYFEDCNQNATPDLCDIYDGTSLDCDLNAVPDECEDMLTALYVDGSATDGLNDGSSWSDAYLRLEDALRHGDCSETIAEVRIAQGTYRPDTAGLLDQREATFVLANGVVVAGGYRGVANGGNPNDRDVSVFETILTGDIGVPGDSSDNCYHVVTSGYAIETAVLDGVTITGGNADSLSGLGGWFGGGMYNRSGNPTLIDCTFRANSALSRGGGLYSWLGTNVSLTNCTFRGNSAGWGGGMYEADSPTLTNCTFVGNAATAGGGLCANGSPTLLNCSFAGNTADDEGGGMYAIWRASASNCVFWGNAAPAGSQIQDSSGELTVTFSCVWGGWPGPGNIDADPLFVDPDGPDNDPNTWEDNDYRLRSGSPCIDAGDNTAVPLDVADLDGDGYTDERTPFDLDGNQRFVQDPFSEDTGVPDPPLYWHIVDMGAYEYQFCFGDLDDDDDIDLADLAQLLGSYGETTGMTYYDGDLDGDGDVDLADLAELLGAYSTLCG